jgi:UDP-N-acetylmuramate--alanine ligase
MYNRKLHFHFTGICGSGMSGIAEVLLNLGFRVSGSDLSTTGPVAERLKSLGAVISAGHARANVAKDASLVVYSSAVSLENPELVEARDRGLPVVRRAEVLAELMRLRFGIAVAGSHGKTTTTSMTAVMLEAGGLDPTVIVGGQIRSMATGARLGKSDFLVAETDESDRSFLLLKPTIAIVTNIDAEHLNAYSSLQDLEDSFANFIAAVPFYGLAILCIDDPKVRDLFSRFKGRKISYGLAPDAQVRTSDVKVHNGTTSFVIHHPGLPSFPVTLNMPGIHLAQNATAAITAALELGVKVETIQAALKSFKGVKRRIEVIGEKRGITVINDYAHHPTEIRATLAAIRAGWDFSKGQKLHVCFQPHRYTRTRDCFIEFLKAFGDADSLCLSEIYAASEAPIEGVSGQALFDAIHHPEKHFEIKCDDHLGYLKRTAKPGDVIACLGAGSIGALAERLPEAL